MPRQAPFVLMPSSGGPLSGNDSTSIEPTSPQHLRNRSLSSRFAGQESPAQAQRWSPTPSPPSSHSAAMMSGYHSSPPSPSSLASHSPFLTNAQGFRNSSASLASSSAAARARFDLHQQSDATVFGDGAEVVGGGRGVHDEAVVVEDEDLLHKAEPMGKREGYARYIQEDRSRGIGWSGLLNIASVIGLFAGITFLFLGWPVMNWIEDITSSYNLTSASTSSAISTTATNITTRIGPIDPDTPTSAYTITGESGKEMQLVFSDEFNTDGRIFYGDMDPYWEAVDLHYWQTDDDEWYDPDAITTSNGSLVITLTKEDNASSHDLGYIGGMLQSWNKFCWTGGRIEISVSLPGDKTYTGLWPAAWMMGNLGRAGYGASLAQMWPYSYDVCDVGTLANQTDTSGLPEVPDDAGSEYYDNSLSYLEGQRLSRCTCPGEDHPGPIDNTTGEYVGRSAPEIDIFEALLSGTGKGNVSQSAQFAPFNFYYAYTNDDSTDSVKYYNSSKVSGTHDPAGNPYQGGVYQQVASGLSFTNSDMYNTTDTNKFSTLGTEYTPTYMNGYGTGEIYWINDEEPMWWMRDDAMAANNATGVGNRTVTGEPLYNIINLGMSSSFQSVELTELTFPAMFRIDWIRIYQPANETNIGCSPELFPTAAYIEKHMEAYTNANLTTWSGDYGGTTPKNRLIDTC